MEREYFKRLSNWVVEESARVGSEHKLAEILGLDHATLIKWRKMLLRKGLSVKSIEAIAQYQGISRIQTESWLFGLKQPDSSLEIKANSLRETIAILEEDISTLKTTVIRLKANVTKISLFAERETAKILSTQPGDTYKNRVLFVEAGESMVDLDSIGRGPGAIGRLICAEMEQKELDPFQDESFRVFAGFLPLIEGTPNYEKVCQVWSHEIPYADDDIIAAIALALTDFSGNYYHPNDLRYLNESVDNGHTNGCITSY